MIWICKNFLAEFVNHDELVHWYNDIRPHQSLDWDKIETPQKAFIRKLRKNSSEIERGKITENKEEAV